MQTNWFCRMNKINVDFKKIVRGLGKTDVRLSTWTQLSSFTTISYHTLAPWIITPDQHMNPID